MSGSMAGNYTSAQLNEETADLVTEKILEADKLLKEIQEEIWEWVSEEDQTDNAAEDGCLIGHIAAARIILFRSIDG